MGFSSGFKGLILDIAEGPVPAWPGMGRNTSPVELIWTKKFEIATDPWSSRTQPGSIPAETLKLS